MLLEHTGLPVARTANRARWRLRPGRLVRFMLVTADGATSSSADTSGLLGALAGKTVNWHSVRRRRAPQWAGKVIGGGILPTGGAG